MRFDASQHAWARMMWNALADRGQWGVPRSGLVFQKREGKLALVDRFGWMDGFPVPADQLRRLQDDDILGIRQLFGDIGVDVVDLTDALGGAGNEEGVTS